MGGVGMRGKRGEYQGLLLLNIVRIKRKKIKKVCKGNGVNSVSLFLFKE
jgi:hypothetical protein